ncbi:hypothetical protein M407DRAFT_240828 [Tulasnella calospora MUT 4182]|uniref:DUF7719 domain-containing protein n=1 Tax=Tulasnella calospora MUT 4182 TaxID=1051891 RepID=A0A0C3QXV0_9AGAM|nr:hypothetical protein M407DRAFT_240828 [Tulasnella calospora MUT 4182]
MAKRKQASSQPDIPLAKPPQDDSDRFENFEDISPEEQERLIKESGLLGKVQKIQRAPEQTVDFADNVFNTVLYVIPLGFLYVIMDVLIHQQYGQDHSMAESLKRLVSGLPFLAVLVFYTHRFQTKRLVQLALVSVAVGSGSGLIYQLNLGSWTENMQRGPPLLTLWVFAVIQMDLLPCSVSLALVYGIARYNNLSLGLVRR